jgi:selenocysteine-specific elongation factor
LLAARHLQHAADRLIAIVTAAHKANPMSEGLAREEAREKVFAKVAPAIFEKVLEDLKGKKALIGSERLALPTHKVTVAGADDRVRTAIIAAFRDGGLRPPEVATLAAASKAPAAVIEKVIALLLREKILTRVDTIVFHAEALLQLKADVTALKHTAVDGRATVDVGAFKDRYGISRKFAIPLLEFLDRERVTRRTGDVRLVL